MDPADTVEESLTIETELRMPDAKPITANAGDLNFGVDVVANLFATAQLSRYAKVLAWT